MQNSFDFILSLNIWSVAKVFALLAFFIYVCFSFILIKQVSMMSEVVVTKLGFLIKTISSVLFLVAIAVFAVVFLFL